LSRNRKRSAAIPTSVASVVATVALDAATTRLLRAERSSASDSIARAYHSLVSPRSGKLSVVASFTENTKRIPIGR
jgi:hypothetical protein